MAAGAPLLLFPLPSHPPFASASLPWAAPSASPFYFICIFHAFLLLFPSLFSPPSFFAPERVKNDGEVQLALARYGCLSNRPPNLVGDLRDCGRCRGWFGISLFHEAAALQLVPFPAPPPPRLLSPPSAAPSIPWLSPGGAGATVLSLVPSLGAGGPWEMVLGNGEQASPQPEWWLFNFGVTKVVSCLVFPLSEGFALVA